jgi:hypothetical protein
MNTTIPENVITWLLQDSNPSVKARTLMELLGQDEVCPEVLQAKSWRLFARMANGRAWGHRPSARKWGSATWASSVWIKRIQL